MGFDPKVNLLLFDKILYLSLPFVDPNYLQLLFLLILTILHQVLTKGFKQWHEELIRQYI